MVTLYFTSIFNYSVTLATRGKTKKHDYCFMAEHDLPPIVLYSDSAPPPPTLPPDDLIINIDRLRESLPELPAQTRERLGSEYG